MQRIAAICLTLGAIGVAYSYAQVSENTNGSPPAEITALQQRRIALLQERVSRLEPLVEFGTVDRAHVLWARIDVINARLEYATSNDEKRALLTELIAEYDRVIQGAEAAMRAAAPMPAPRPGQRTTILPPSCELLFWKSERIRIQILRDRLV